MTTPPSLVRWPTDQPVGSELKPSPSMQLVTRSKVVLVDQCGVVYDDSIWSRWLYQLIGRSERCGSYETFCEDWEANYLSPIHCGQVGYWDALRQFLASAGLSRGYIEELCVAAIARRRTFEQNIRVLPGVKSTLVQLRVSGLHLALFAKCAFDTATVHANLLRMGMDTCFDDVLVSLELSKESSQAPLWTTAAKRLGTAPESIAFVSAKPAHLAGAQTAGMQAIALEVPKVIPGALHIEQISELVRSLPSPNPRSLAG